MFEIVMASLIPLCLIMYFFVRKRLIQRASEGVQESMLNRILLGLTLGLPLTLVFCFIYFTDITAHLLRNPGLALRESISISESESWFFTVPWGILLVMPFYALFTRPRTVFYPKEPATLRPRIILALLVFVAVIAGMLYALLMT